MSSLFAHQRTSHQRISHQTKSTRCNSGRKGFSQRGFTLIELLLSLAIFGMLGMATYSVLNNTIAGKEAIQSQTKQLVELQRGMMFIENDFRQLAQRKVRIAGEEPTDQYFIAEPYLFDSEELGFAFVRDGWTNPAMMLPRSEMQVVIYRVRENVLERLYFNYVDADVGTEPRIQPILKGISELEISYVFDSANDLEWEVEIEGKQLPKLIKLKFLSDTFGQVERVFEVVEKTEMVQQPQSGPSSPNSPTDPNSPNTPGGTDNDSTPLNRGASQ